MLKTRCQVLLTVNNSQHHNSLSYTLSLKFDAGNHAGLHYRLIDRKSIVHTLFTYIMDEYTVKGKM